ncbi:MAG TPA: SDR family NAD(P)-dependent oxidoreductase [Steroidobacteraceae bacterium]|jgi:3-oxoacyl-[acyl-carrier protein] reductase|nr:SDR family NAD(P)-dependent oxidoreductase [Steroidobacteraceae bacterium]
MQNVIVTGGSRGLGLAMARALAAAGYRVIALSRRSTGELEAASRAAADSGRGAIEFRACDLSDLGSIAPLVKALRADFGALYGLVNNAGLGSSGLLSNMRDQEIQRLIQLNTVSPILLSKYVVRSMMSQREGRIINIASIVATTGYSGLSVYSATKASLLGFTRSLAREVGQLGITVNAVAPGFVATEMTQELEETQRQQIARRSALKRMADPIDVARGVEFLLGDGGRNITGTTLTIDAGNTA